MTETVDHSDDDRLVDALCSYQADLESGTADADAVSRNLPTELQAEFDAERRTLELLHSARTSIKHVLPTLTGPKRIGQFNITGAPKYGGCGIVYPAVDPAINRPVAIKVPKPEHLVSREMVERFVLEANAIARLDHPHILRIYECKISDITPYIVMPWIDGPTLEQWRRTQQQVDPRVAARIALALASAVAQAHERGVLHRDITPRNILLESSPNAPFADSFPYVPLLSDFGLARLFEQMPLTSPSGAAMGTPGYRPPEQSPGQVGEQTTRSDLYGIGAVLYFLLAGAPPYPNDPSPRAGETPPSFKSRLLRVPADLEVICRNCLEFSPKDRYGTAHELAADLEHFLRGEPIIAKPPAASRRIGMWCRRHPAWASLIAVASVALIALVSMELWYNARLDRQLQISEQARRDTEQRDVVIRHSAYRSDMALAGRAWNGGNVEQARTLLQRYLPRPGEPDLRDFVWKYLWRQVTETSQVLGRHAGGATSAAVSPDGQCGATGGEDGVIRIWKLPEGTLHHEIDGHGRQRINALEISPDGRWLASAADDNAFRVWELHSGQEQFSNTKDHHVEDVAFSSDGRLLAAGGADQVIHLWRTETWELMGDLRGHTGGIVQLAFQPSGTLLASTSRDGTLRLWDVNRQAFEERLPDGVLYRADSRWPRVLQFSPDGTHLVCATSHTKCFQWSLLPETFGQEEALPAALARPLENVRGMAWPMHGTLTWANLPIHFMNHFKEPDFSTLRGHTDSVSGLAANDDASLLLSASGDGEVRLWKLSSSRDVLPVNQPDGGPLRWVNGGVGRVSLNNHQFITEPLDSRYTVFQLSDGTQTTVAASSGLNSQAIRLSHSGNFLISYLSENRFVRHCVATGQVNWNVAAPAREPPHETLHAIDSRDRFVAASCANDVVILDAENGETFRTFPHPKLVSQCVFFEPPGQPLQLVSGCRDGFLRQWNIETGEFVRQWEAHTRGVTALALSADGSLLASSGYDRQVRIWRAETGELVTKLSRRGAAVRLAFFSAKNYLLCGDNTLSLWDIAGPTEILEFAAEIDPYLSTVSPDGKTLAICRSYQIDLLRDEQVGNAAP